MGRIAAIIAGFSLALMATPSLAQNAVQSGSQSGAVSSVNVEGSTSYKQAPSLGGFGLTTSNDTCAGSFGLNASVGGFGIGGGSTYVIEDCNARADAKLLAQMGMTNVAIQRLAQRPKIRAAIEAANQITRQQVARQIRSGRPPANAPITRLADIPRGARYFDKRDGRWKIKR